LSISDTIFPLISREDDVKSGPDGIRGDPQFRIFHKHSISYDLNSLERYM